MIVIPKNHKQHFKWIDSERKKLDILKLNDPRQCCGSWNNLLWRNTTKSIWKSKILPNGNISKKEKKEVGRLSSYQKYFLKIGPK